MAQKGTLNNYFKVNKIGKKKYFLQIAYTMSHLQYQHVISSLKWSLSLQGILYT